MAASTDRSGTGAATRADAARGIRCLTGSGRRHIPAPSGERSHEPRTPADVATREELVEFVAREIQLRGLTGPAVMFLESSRAYGPLGSQAMLFFDPVLRSLFGGDLAEAQRVLAD